MVHEKYLIHAHMYVSLKFQPYRYMSSEKKIANKYSGVRKKIEASDSYEV